MNLFKKIFGEKKRKINDPDFGILVFDVQSEAWNMEGRWQNLNVGLNASCIDIAGDNNGPYKKAKEFLLTKKDNIQKLWFDFEELLCIELKKYNKFSFAEDPFKYMYIEQFSGSSNMDWEISFESFSKEEESWIHITFINNTNGVAEILVTT